MFEPGPPEDVSTWANTPQQGLECCTSMPKPAFFWDNPFIFDKKTVVDLWDLTMQPPAVIKVYKQWVAIKVPTCGPGGDSHRFLVEGPFTFVVKHIGDGKVTHCLKP